MRKILIPLFLLAVFISCHKNAVTGKRSLQLMPESDLMAMSLTEYDKFLAEHPPLPPTDERVVMVRRCGLKIQKAVEQFHAQKNASKDLEGFNWEFNVVDNKEVN